METLEKTYDRSEKLKDEFLNDLYKLKEPSVDYIFSKIVDQRTLQIERLIRQSGRRVSNLAETFESNEASIARQIKLEKLPHVYSEIERKAIKIFGNILNCWTEFEIFKYKQKAKKEFEIFKKNKKFLDHNPSSGYQAEIIKDISKDRRFFKIDGLDCPARLSNAIILCNLFQFVRGQKWFEMLQSLALSTKGKHFIYYKTNHNFKYPEIISTALILDYPQKKIGLL